MRTKFGFLATRSLRRLERVSRTLLRTLLTIACLSVSVPYMRANVSGQRRKSADDFRFISMINEACAERHECGRTNVFALSRRKQGFDSPRERQIATVQNKTANSGLRSVDSDRPRSSRSEALAKACQLRASLSRRLVRRNLLDLRREHVFGRFEIKARLNVHPERSAGLEELAEPQRGVGCHGLFFARDAFDPGTRHVQRGRDRVGCQLERNEKFFPQDFAGMNRRKFHCHVRTPIRWPHSAGALTISPTSPKRLRARNDRPHSRPRLARPSTPMPRGIGGR